MKYPKIIINETKFLNNIKVAMQICKEKKLKY